MKLDATLKAQLGYVVKKHFIEDAVNYLYTAYPQLLNQSHIDSNKVEKLVNLALVAGESLGTKSRRNIIHIAESMVLLGIYWGRDPRYHKLQQKAEQIRRFKGTDTEIFSNLMRALFEAKHSIFNQLKNYLFDDMLAPPIDQTALIRTLLWHINQMDKQGYTYFGGNVIQVFFEHVIEHSLQMGMCNYRTIYYYSLLSYEWGYTFEENPLISEVWRFPLQSKPVQEEEWVHIFENTMSNKEERAYDNNI